MSNRTSPAIPTAAEALATIATWHDLDPSRRRSLATAVKTYHRRSGHQPLEILRLDPARCLPEMDTASHAALRISKKTLANARTGLRYTLRRIGLLAPVRQAEPVTDPRWLALIERLPARFHPHRLRAFAAFCARSGVAPGSVTDETLSDYLDHRETTRGGDNNRADVSEVARQWAKAAATIDGWPQTTLALPPLTNRFRALPFTAYPASLQADLADFTAWCGQESQGPLFGEEDARDSLSPESVVTHLKSLRLLLAGMVATGSPPDSITELGVLLRDDVLKRVFRWHLGRLGGKPCATLGTMAATIQTLAAQQGLDDQRREALRRLLRNARPKRQRELTRRNADLLDRLDDPVTRGKLLDLPWVLMKKAQKLRSGWTTRQGVNHPAQPREACWLAAIAAAIEIELHLPVRLHDLAGLRLEDQLRLDLSDGRRPRVHLRVLANKTGSLVETQFEGESAELLRSYIQEFRPLGPHPDTPWLFPHRDTPDRPRAEGGFSEAITEQVERHTGVRASVQTFRCFAAVLILEANPHALEDVRAVLGHASFEMALRYYRRHNRHAAGQRLSAALASQRRKSGLTAAALGFQIARLDRRQQRR